ncbi:MAG: tRNA (adenosine(37)-N6)-threonylcarbamoyltransferase complex dimerization subunit type 1 TsaB [Elusimicrobiota bacterium]
MVSTEKKKIYLAIETTTDVFSIALGDNEGIITEKSIPGRRHSEFLMPGIQEILEESGLSMDDVKAVGAGVGPGSFTGIRVGLSTAVTIGQVKKIPVYGISSMDLAGKETAHPVILAFRDKYYHAEYDDDGTRKTPFNLISADEKDELEGKPVQISASRFIAETVERHKLGDRGDWREIEPVYVMTTVYKPKKMGV